MTNNTLLDGGSYSFDPAHPYEIQFSNAADIHLPFPGTVIVPANNDTTTPSLGGMYQMMFLSLKYPTKIDHSARTFPVLRDYENKPLTVNAFCLILAADDNTFLDNVHLGNLADDFSNTYDPIYKDNTVLSSTARYLMIQFNPTNGPSLPGNLKPLSRGKGFKLKNNTEGGNDQVEILRNALGSGVLSGKILAFDLAGHQTEAYSSLLALGVNMSPITPPDPTQIRIQFVDIHGSPVTFDDFPLNKLDHEPSLDGLAEYGTNKYFFFNPTDPTGKKAEFKLQVKNSGSPPSDAEKYLHRFHYTAVWPGYGSSFKQIGHDQATTLDFFKDIPEGSPKPRFVRLVLFHPADEFQTTAGGEIEIKQVKDYVSGEIEERAVFKDNGFRLFTHRNTLKLFNTGEGYFGDYHDEVNKLKDGDSLYQANWSGNAHLHLKGSMKTRLIQPSDAEPADVTKTLQFIRDHALLVPVDPRQPDNQGRIHQDYLLLTHCEPDAAQITTSFAIDVETKSAPGSPAAGQVHRGFVRPQAVFAWKLKGHPNSFADTNHSLPQEHTVYAYWKNTMGMVQTTSLDNLIDQASTVPIHQLNATFPTGIIALDINGQDPPQAVIRRTQKAEPIRNLLGLSGSPISPILLVLNLSAGSSHKIPLIPAGSEGSDDFVLATLAEDVANGIPGMTGDDVLAIAVIKDQPPDDQDFSLTLLTSFKTFVYSNEAHANAAVPRLPTESGGLLRQAIAKGVTVRALMWEHLLKRLAGGDDIAKGHGNNHQLVNLINRTINGKRGYAFIDQATRELGAWHQKPVVMMRQVKENLGDDASFEGVAYLGGMDMALGRWETEYYFSRDPDRQTMGQNDVQMKMTGDAAWDVLQNFRHRWKGIDLFLHNSDVFCNPVNTSAELEDEVSQPFFVPDPAQHRVKYPKSGNAFIQVNRTMPPYTCFSQQPIDGIIIPPRDGELGSLASYKKGLERARKFIFITEQYFFSPEIAIAVHDALLKADGPEFAVLVLPLELDESKYVDPLFFKLRQKNLNILRYGYVTPASSNCGELIPLEPGTSQDVSSRIAILSLVNYQGKDIYTHSKHIIVDDVWMTAGSANMSNRGLTYEMEINAAVVGQKLYEGGTAVVREQRIELCRRLLGLPKAYTAVLEDPYAAFRLFKAIEKQEDGYSLNVYPLKPLVKWLNTSYIKRVPEDTQFDAKIDFVMNMDVNDPSFNYVICNLLDADGRRHDADRLGYLAHLIGMGKVLSYALANLGITFGPTAYDPIRGLLLTGNPVTLTINTTICPKKLNEQGEPELDDQGNPIRLSHGPYLQHQYPLVYNSAENVIELEGLASNQLSVTISTEHLVVVTAVLTNKTTGQTLSYSGQLTFDPDLTSIVYGQQYDATLQIV